MYKLNALKILFAIAALLFVAKPFIGFGAIKNVANNHKRESIIDDLEPAFPAAD